MTDLGTLSGDTISEALGINDLGQVVGYSGGRGFLYSGGTMVDLNSLVDPSLECNLQAMGINDRQQIVAVGSELLGDSGQEHAALLSPEFPGDANLDGKVDVNDLTIVLTNFGQTGGLAAGCMDGDATGTVDVNDLTIVLANYGRSIGWSAAGAAAVPEPSTLLLAAVGLAALSVRAGEKRQ